MSTSCCQGPQLRWGSVPERSPGSTAWGCQGRGCSTEENKCRVVFLGRRRGGVFFFFSFAKDQQSALQKPHRSGPSPCPVLPQGCHRGWVSLGHG